MQPIASLRPGNKAAVLGEIKSANVAMTRRRGFRIFHAVARRRERRDPLHVDEPGVSGRHPQAAPRSSIFGDVKLDSSGLHFLNPEYELVSDDSRAVHTGRIVPFYEKTGTVTPNMQRQARAAGARRAAARTFPICCPPTCARGCSCMPRRRGARGGALSAERGEASRSSTRFARRRSAG